MEGDFYRAPDPEWLVDGTGTRNQSRGRVGEWWGVVDESGGPTDGPSGPDEGYVLPLPRRVPWDTVRPTVGGGDPRERHGSL